MRVSFSPIRMAGSMVASVEGDVITIKGTALDLSPLGEGEAIPATALDSSWVVGPVQRVSGEIQITILLPIGRDASAAARFPEPVTVTSGAVPIPS